MELMTKGRHLDEDGKRGCLSQGYAMNPASLAQGPVEAVHKAALALGTANQLTNILRDVGQDAVERNRIYVPLEELDQFGISESEVRRCSRCVSGSALLMALIFQGRSAQAWFTLGAAATPPCELCEARRCALRQAPSRLPLHCLASRPSCKVSKGPLAALQVRCGHGFERPVRSCAVMCCAGVDGDVL